MLCLFSCFLFPVSDVKVPKPMYINVKIGVHELSLYPLIGNFNIKQETT